MNGSASQVRLLVMVLVGWCALSAAPVVANSPALPAAFFVIAVGLVAAVTLRFSTLVGLVMAVVGTALFAVSMVLDPATAASRGGVQGLTGAFARLDQLVPALVAAVSLVGVAVCASLASWEIDGRPGAIQEVARRADAGEDVDEIEDRASVTHDRGRDEEAGQVATATLEQRPVQDRAEDAQPAPAAVEEPVSERRVQEAAGAAAAEPAASQLHPAAEEASRAQEPAAPQPSEAERPAAQETPTAAPAAAGESRRDGGPASAGERQAVEQTPAVEEPVPSREPAVVEEQAAAPEAASEAQVTRPEDAPVAAPAETPPPAGEVKGEEIAARDIQEKNGSTEGERPQPARPDLRHRRRADDDVARRLPRRRKR
jgi:hypothetical protein